MKASRREIDYVVENILGALIGGVRREIEKGKKPPNAEALRKILEADLGARGYAIQPASNAEAARRVHLALFDGADAQ